MNLERNYPFLASLRLLHKTAWKGNLAENLAITFLLKKGNLIFKTIHDTGCVDIMTIDKRGQIHLYDVKSVSRYHSGKKKGRRISRTRTAYQKKLGVELLFVDLDNNKCWITDHV